jgi:hypothetical protein
MSRGEAPAGVAYTGVVPGLGAPRILVVRTQP